LEQALDANGDGIIDAKELANAASGLRGLDRNGDGRLTEDEFRPVRPTGGGFGGGAGSPGGKGGFGNQPGGKNFGGPGTKAPGGPSGEPGSPDGKKATASSLAKGGDDFVQRLFQNDKNNDGKLTKAELPESLQLVFDTADTNRDGVIDRQEAGVLAERMKTRGTSPGTDGKRPPLEK